MLKILSWVARTVFVLVRRPMCVSLVLLAMLPLTAYVAWKAGGGGRPAPGFGPVVVTHAAGTPMGIHVLTDHGRPERIVRVYGKGAFTKDGAVKQTGKIFFIADGVPGKDGPAHGGPSR